MALFGSWLADLITAIFVLISLIYVLITSTHSTWKKKKVPYVEPSFPFGNFGSIFRGKASFNSVCQEFYTQFKQHGFGGVYIARTPVLIVCKPDLIKDFVTKDFNSFNDHGMPYDGENDPFAANLVNVSGEQWKTMRAKLSPTFTSGKIRGMFPLVYECAQELTECIQLRSKEQPGSVEMKDLLVRFSTDVIGTCAFGIECHSLRNKNNEFYKVSTDLFKNTAGSLIRSTLISVFPRLAKVLTFKRQHPKPVNFFSETIYQTVKFRRQNNVERNDFVQMMMKINEADADAFSLEVMVANTIVFFFAGLDNVAQTVGFSLHEMALNPDLQEKVYQEIKTVLEEHEDEMTYEALGKMDLLGRVIDEALRMYSPSGVLIRKQTSQKYVIPGTDIVTEGGTSVFIPVQAIHRDAEYFPNPDKFDPDRFTAEEKQKRHPYVYLPFGEGPRFCIASRFALLEMRICLAELLRRFQFDVAPETDITMELDLAAIGPTPKKGFWFTVTERDKL